MASQPPQPPPQPPQLPRTLSRSASVSYVTEIRPSDVRVLLVDDDRSSLKAAGAMLREAQYDVTTLSDPTEALAQIGSGRFNLLITDLYMDKTDGLDLVKFVRSSDNAAVRYMPIVVLSQTTELSMSYQCVRAGADGFIIKPARFDVLRDVWQVVARKRSEEAMMQELDAKRARIHGLEHTVSEAVATPIRAVMETLTKLAASEGVNKDAREALLAVLRSMSLSDLYRPRLQSISNEIDSTSRTWLSDVLGFKDDDNNTESSTSVSPAPLSPQMRNSIRMEPIAVSSADLARWDFSMWDYSESQLRQFAMQMFDDLELCEKLSVPRAKLEEFVRTVSGKYVDNPYHNFRHAFDVAQAVYSVMVEGGGMTHLKPLEQFAVLVAALGHDAAHPGRNNAFQVNTLSDLALCYNDRSVLENYHSAETFRIIHRLDGCNFTSEWPREMYVEFRKLVIDCILLTDLAEHGSFMSRIALVEAFEPTNAAHRAMLCQLIVKAGDVSNGARPFSLAKYWADVLAEEFFGQGDDERSRCMPVSAFMDRSCPQQGRLSVTFIDFICMPIYKNLSRFCPHVGHLLEHLENNRSKWSMVQDAEAAEAARVTANATAAATAPAAPGAADSK